MKENTSVVNTGKLLPHHITSEPKDTVPSTVVPRWCFGNLPLYWEGICVPMMGMTKLLHDTYYHVLFQRPAGLHCELMGGTSLSPKRYCAVHVWLTLSVHPKPSQHEPRHAPYQSMIHRKQKKEKIL